MKLFLCVLVALSAQPTWAQIHIEKLKWTDKKAEKQKVTADLRNQKQKEVERKWVECTQLGKKNFAKQVKIQGWVLSSWLRCGRELAVEKKSAVFLREPVATLDLHSDLLWQGAWKQTLLAESIKSKFVALELYDKAQAKESWAIVNSLMEIRDRLDKPQKAKLFEKAADLAQAQAQLKVAQYYFEQSLNEQDSKSAKDKLASIQFALNVMPTEKSEPLKANGNGSLQSNSEVNRALLNDEEKLEEQIKSSLKSGDQLVFLSDLVKYLNLYPGGKRAKWCQEKALDLYLQFFDQAQSSKDVERAKSLVHKAIEILLNSDSSRLSEWSRQLHRKGDFNGSLAMAEKVLNNFPLAVAGANSIYIAGRSAQFLGDYRKAKKYFELYLDRFSGAEDISEVYFRLGLVNVRLQEFSSAVAVFEKLLVQKNIDKYELSGRYWLIRCLQVTKNLRAPMETEALLKKWPLSYYGLRLKLEQTAGQLDWPGELAQEKSLSGEYPLLDSQKAVWDRIRLLAVHGWMNEAISEISELPNPNDPSTKVLLAKELNELQIFPMAIRLINEAGDLDPNLRSLDIIYLSLPQVYKETIADQAAKQKLSPILVRSLIRQESAFGAKAVSTSNAMGLMQLIGPTAQEVAVELGLRQVNFPDDVYLPDTNIQMGTYYIAKMIKQFGGNVPLGLAAYNAGPARVKLFVQARREIQKMIEQPTSDPWQEIWFDEIPWMETSFYVKAILRNSMLYKVADLNSKLPSDAKPDQRRAQLPAVLWSDLVLPKE